MVNSWFEVLRKRGVEAGHKEVDRAILYSVVYCISRAISRPPLSLAPA